MEILQEYMPYEIVLHILSYGKCLHHDLECEILKDAFGPYVFNTLLNNGGIIIENGHVTKVSVWERGELATYDERHNICFDIKILNKLPRLFYCILWGTEVTGNIGQLKSLQHLKDLSFCYTNVTGDIGQLKSLQTLERCMLDDTDVTGNIMEIRKLPKLIQLGIDWTAIECNVKQFENYRSLNELEWCYVSDGTYQSHHDGF